MAAADVNLSVKVQGDEIVVTLPGTSYVLTYYRAAAFPQQLLTKSHSGPTDGPIGLEKDVLEHLL